MVTIHVSAAKYLYDIWDPRYVCVCICMSCVCVTVYKHRLGCVHFCVNVHKGLCVFFLPLEST